MLMLISSEKFKRELHEFGRNMERRFQISVLLSISVATT
jgi:hypothetical protein